MRLTPDEPLLGSPRYLGVDDFCWRRGQTYGTILVDLESGRVIDLLPDRAAATFAAWLQQHPGAELISRDRASAYSEGAARGAPNARQAADRFHLLKNLGNALEELLSRLRSELRQNVQRPTISTTAAAPRDGDQQAVSAKPPTDDLPPTTPGNCKIEIAHRNTQPTSSRTAVAPPLVATSEPTRQPKRALSQQRPMALSQSRRSERLARYEEVCRLHELGWSQRAIAKQVNLVPKTVRRWLQQGRFPERQDPPARASKLDGYKVYIRTRCEQGCWNAKQIWQEITEQQGYRGGHTRVRDFVAELRKEPKLGGQEELPVASVLGWQLPSARELKWLLMKAVAELDDERYELVRELCRQSRDVTVAYGLITDFAELVRNRRASELNNWVELARASGVREMECFARGILRDFAAVYTGLELEWSNGVVEGHVNRLKLFKRQGYGRAKLDLLRKRLLHAS